MGNCMLLSINFCLMNVARDLFFHAFCSLDNKSVVSSDDEIYVIV